MASNSTIGKKGKIIHSQGREIIHNVISFCKEESTLVEPRIPLSNCKERAIALTDVSESTYKRVLKEYKSIESGEQSVFKSPRKQRPKVHTKTNLYRAEEEYIREIVYNFYITDKRRPTLKGILAKIREGDVPFSGSLSTLRRLLLNFGFKWQKVPDNWQFLIETKEIWMKRMQYLRAISNYRNEGRPIVYIDETYIHSSHTQTKDWFDNSLSGLKRPISKGQRLIIVHAGGEMGFIKNALLIFRSGTKTGDFHDDMNNENFTRWIQKQLLPNLPDRAVLVLDNASYHNVRWLHSNQK